MMPAQSRESLNTVDTSAALLRGMHAIQTRFFVDRLGVPAAWQLLRGPAEI